MLRNGFSLMQKQREEPWPPVKCILEESVLFPYSALFDLTCGFIEDPLPSARATKSVPLVGAHSPSKIRN